MGSFIMEDPIKCDICGCTGSLYRPFGTDGMRCVSCLRKELKKAAREEGIEISRFELLDFE